MVSASEASPPTLQKRGRILSRTEKACAPREPKPPPPHCIRGQEVALVFTPCEPKRENSVLFLALVSASLVSRSLPPCTGKVGENSVARREGTLVSTPCELQRENSVHFLSIQSCSASVLNTLPAVYFVGIPGRTNPFFVYKKAPAIFLIPKCTNRVCLWYRMVKYREIPTGYQPKIPRQYVPFVLL